MTAPRLMQPTFAGGVIGPGVYGRVDVAKYSTAIAVGRNVFIRPQGGISNRCGTEFVNETRNSPQQATLFPFEFNDDQTYVLELGELYGRVYRDGALILEDTPKVITAISAASPAIVTIAGHGYAAGVELDIRDVVGVDGVTSQNVRVRAPITVNNFAIENIDGTPFDSSALPLYVSGGNAYKVVEFVTPYNASQVDDVWVLQEADVMYLCHGSHPPQKLSRIAEDNWVMSVPTFYPTIASPTGVGVVATGAGTVTYKYVVSAISRDNAEESLPSAEVTCTNDLTVVGQFNTITWAAVTDAVRYIVYKYDNGSFGYIGGSNGLTFKDDNITADLADGPPEYRNPFNATGKYPTVAEFHEQRLCFAATRREPQLIEMSQSANYENFGRSSPAKPNQAITIKMRGRKVSDVRALVSAKGLLVYTSSAEWQVTGGSEDYLTPSNPKFVNQGYRGSSKLQPIRSGNTFIFAQNRGCVVRDSSFQFTDDAYVGKDLTVLARHYFDGRTIVSWAYAQSPHSIIYVILDDGTCKTLTYIKEHDIWGWSEMDTDGSFERVTVIGEHGEDVPYFIVRRVIDGNAKRYIERLHPRDFSDATGCFFVDSGLSYDGAPVTVLSGLYHLEGETLVALADGNVVKGLVVTNGAVTLPNAASVVHVGLSYESAIKTLELEVGAVQGLGTLQGRMKSISDVTIRIEDTRGMWIGPTENNLTEFKQRAYEDWGDPIDLKTGDVTVTTDWDWTRGGSMWIKQFDPLPMTINAIMPEVTNAR